MVMVVDMKVVYTFNQSDHIKSSSREAGELTSADRTGYETATQRDVE